MADVLLENTNVFEPKKEFGVEELRKKFEQEQAEFKSEYNNVVLEKHNLQTAYADLSAENEQFFNYTEEDLRRQKDNIDKSQHEIIGNAAESRRNTELLDKYEGSFAALYQIKRQNEYWADGTTCSFKEIEQNKPAGIITQEQYYEMNANPNGEVKQLALEVALPSGEKFDLTMPPYDKPGADSKDVKAQISFDDKALQELNAEKLAHIMEFCENHGLSTFQMDIPYVYDGNIDAAEKMKSLLEQVKQQKISAANAVAQQEVNEQQNQRQELQKTAPVNTVENANAPVSYDLPPENQTIEAESTLTEENHQQSVLNQLQQQAQNRQAQVPAPQAAPQSKIKAKPAKGIKEAEAGFEKFLEGGLRKSKGFTYFKEHTGWLGTGWTEYIVYDKSDPDNRKKDGKIDKNGEAKFTYSFKLFVKEEKGKLRFAYRTPGNKKIDDSVVNGIAGQFKDLGITHIRFPNGLQDAEKKLWRVALAENGIVPVGMGLDKAKAEGMLKAAKEKLSAEAYRKFRYKLAVQMEKDNIKKGKIVSPSEQDYIDGIKNSQKYLAFTDGYDGKLKGMLRDKLDAADVNHDDGAIDKTAAYMAMRRLFDVYKETVDNADILHSRNLSSEEKQKIKQAGLTGPVSDFTVEQMGQLYDIMLVKSKADAKKEIDEALLAARDVNNQSSKGAKRADNVIIKEVFDGARNRFEKVNEMLAPLGVDEISFPKSFGRLHYDNFYKEHPEFMRKNQQQTQAPQQTSNNQQKPANTAQNTQAAQAFVNAYAAKKGNTH